MQSTRNRKHSFKGQTYVQTIKSKSIISLRRAEQTWQILARLETLVIWTSQSLWIETNLKLLSLLVDHRLIWPSRAPKHLKYNGKVQRIEIKPDWVKCSEPWTIQLIQRWPCQIRFKWWISMLMKEDKHLMEQEIYSLHSVQLWCILKCRVESETSAHTKRQVRIEETMRC